MEKFLIKTKLIERCAVRGILAFLADSLYVADTPDSEKHKTKTLCYIGFFDKIDDDIKNCNSAEEVINSHLAAWHSDIDDTIADLKRTESRAHVEYMVITIENFIKQTILSRCD